MADEFIHSLTDIWNGGSTTFNAIKMNVTDTASASDSKLIDLQIGGVTQFNVGKNGNVVATGNYTGVNGVFSGTMGVTGNATFGGTLAVTGNATFTGTVNGTTIPTTATLVTTTRQVATGTGLTGGGNLSADRTIALANTAVAAGSYGSASAVGTFTVDAQGRLTAAASTNIAIAGEAITSGTVADARLPTSQAGKTFSSAVQFASGTAALPGITFSGDTNTGIWRPAADTLAASTNGAECVRITSTGNVGIGTSSPGSRLDVNTADAQIRVKGAIAGLFIDRDAGLPFVQFQVAGVTQAEIRSANDGSLRLHTNGSTERMRIDSSGNVGIGTSSPGVMLDVRGAVTFGSTAQCRLTVSSAQIFIDAQASGGEMIFRTNPSAGVVERMRIDASGNVLIGQSSTTTPGAGNTTTGAAIQIASGVGTLRASRNGGESLTLNRNTSDGNVAVFFREGASVGSISVTTTATAYNTSSDRRLKDNIAPVTGSGARIDALLPRAFTMKTNGETTRGFIADEFQTVYPNAVTGTPDGDEMQSMMAANHETMADIIAELQSLRTRVGALETA